VNVGVGLGSADPLGAARLRAVGVRVGAGIGTLLEPAGGSAVAWGAVSGFVEVVYFLDFVYIVLKRV
jgi:hypothetical protein